MANRPESANYCAEGVLNDLKVAQDIKPEPQAKPGVPFESIGDFYTALDGEQLTHARVDEALLEHIEDYGELDEPFAATIKRLAPIEVFAFDRNEVSDATWQRLAERAASAIVEDWDDDCDLNGGSERQWTEGMERALATALLPAIKSACPKPYGCHEVGRREYSESELLEMFAEEVGRE